MKKKHNDSQKVFGKMDRWDIPLENDLMFSTVMQCRDACIGLLETIFDGRKVKSLEYKDSPHSVTQKYVVFNPANKSIRLDVYFEDGDGVYDMEIQKVVLEFADFNQERPLNSTKVRVKQNNRTQPIDRLSVLRHFTIGSIGVLAKFT